MPITILRPQAVGQRPSVGPGQGLDTSDSSDSDSGGVDVQGDVSMRAPKRQRMTTGGGDDEDGAANQILTPGSVITSNSQWMR